MSSRFCASIRIGGKIEVSKVEPLLKAIRESGVTLEWGDTTFSPQTPEELMEAKKEKWLEFCDERADHGEFPKLETMCCKLGLGYTRHSEASFDSDAERVDWRPGMKKPLVWVASNTNCASTFVPIEHLHKALDLLEAGKVDKALHTLRNLCPPICELPPLEIV